MKLEDQVISLEHAKKLKELGVNQISSFKWIKANHPTEKTCEAVIEHSGALEDSYDDSPVSGGWTLTSWAAYTVAELGEMLPVTMVFEKHKSGEWRMFDNLNFGFIAIDNNEANARAKMLIYLLENKLI